MKYVTQRGKNLRKKMGRDGEEKKIDTKSCERIIGKSRKYTHTFIRINILKRDAQFCREFFHFY